MKWTLVFMALALVTANNNPLFATDVCDYSPSSARYEPNPDVAHKPNGVEPLIDANQPIAIPVTVDIADRFDLPGYRKGVTLDAELGMLEVDPKTGHMRYNGRDITTSVASDCRKESLQNQNDSDESDDDENDHNDRPDRDDVIDRIHGNAIQGRDITKQGKNIAGF